MVDYRNVDLYWGRCGREWGNRSLLGTQLWGMVLEIPTGDDAEENEKVQVGKEQEKAQSEKDSHFKNQGGKKPNLQSGTYTMKTFHKPNESYFPNRWPLSYLNLTKNMKTYIRRQQHKNSSNTKTQNKKNHHRSIDLERSVTQSYWRV